jgi:type 1 fimbriae regulatory protein FimB
MVIVKAVIKHENAVDDRPKNFLTEAEMGNFLKAARKGRHSVRNLAMLLLTFRHGLRVSELINMRMADVDLDSGRLFVRRLKGSLSTSQPLEGDEIRALTCLATAANQSAVLQFAAGFFVRARPDDAASL